MKAKISINRKPKAKSKKLPTLANLKAKCDKVFSIFIRTRDIDRNGEGECVCCRTRLPWKRLQAAHFISRVHLSTRYNETNVQPACYACNCLRAGNLAEMAAWLQRTYGVGVIENLLAEKRKTVKFSRQDYELMIQRFTDAATGEK
jgi:hypothetical protein